MRVSLDNKKNNNLHKFSITPFSEVPKLASRGIQHDIVKYDRDNLLPQRIIDISKQSPTHFGILMSKKAMIAGNKVVGNSPELNEFLAKCNDGHGMHALIQELAYNYLLFGGFSVRVIPQRIYPRVADIESIDFSKLRRGFEPINANNLRPWETEESVEGKNDRQVLMLSYDWSYANHLKKSFQPETYDYFEFAHAESQLDRKESTILYVWDKSPGYEFYPIPEWYSGYKSVENEVEIINFMYENLKNKFAPSGIMQFSADLDDDTQQEIQETIQRHYTGSQSSGAIFSIFADLVEFKPMPKDVSMEGLMQQAEFIRQQIITAHRLPSPVLAGLPGGATINGDGNTLEEARVALYEQMLQKREIILTPIIRLLKLAGFENPEIKIIDKFTEVDANTDHNNTGDSPIRGYKGQSESRISDADPIRHTGGQHTEPTRHRAVHRDSDHLRKWHDINSQRTAEAEADPNYGLEVSAQSSDSGDGETE